jgi:polyribonucleotide nucleotidyltransferase
MLGVTPVKKASIPAIPSITKKPTAPPPPLPEKDDVVDAPSGILEIDDSGLVKIAAVSTEAGARAREMIEAIVQEPEVGRIYEGPVKTTTTFGAFVEILPGTEGLCHISELAEGRVEKTEDVVKKGDIVRVKLLSIDEKGRLRLSRKAALAEQAQGDGQVGGRQPA